MEEVAKYEGGRPPIDLAKDPNIVLEEARKAAKALTDVIAQKPQDKKVIINGEQYLEFEDWQTLGRFYGYTIKVESTHPVNLDGVRGWEAQAIVLDRHGNIVSAADGMCLDDEEKWSTKAKYEYLYVLKDGTKSKEDPPKDQMVWVPNPKKPGKSMPKKERVKLGDEPVPSFQLRSMAQTRASAKALRNVLAWVVVLAGYRPTPAEEMITEQREEVIEGEMHETAAEENKEPKPDKRNGREKDDFPTIMARERQRLGDERFYRILGEHGHEQVEFIADRKEQIKIYKAVVAEK